VKTNDCAATLHIEQRNWGNTWKQNRNLLVYLAMRPEHEANRSLLFIGEVKNAMRFNFAAQPVRGVMRKCGE
jgi:hypothetical protein